jgi:hypothetical protein
LLLHTFELLIWFESRSKFIEILDIKHLQLKTFEPSRPRFSQIYLIVAPVWFMEITRLFRLISFVVFFPLGSSLCIRGILMSILLEFVPIWFQLFFILLGVLLILSLLLLLSLLAVSITTSIWVPFLIVIVMLWFLPMLLFFSLLLVPRLIPIFCSIEITVKIKLRFFIRLLLLLVRVEVRIKRVKVFSCLKVLIVRIRLLFIVICTWFMTVTMIVTLILLYFLSLLIIYFSLLLIADHVPCGWDLFKLLSCFFASLIFIRVIFLCQFIVLQFYLFSL